MAKTKTKLPLKDRLKDVAAKAAEKRNARQAEAAKAAAAGPAVYRPAIVTFIDILGFKALIKCKPSHEIHEILAMLRDWSEGDSHFLDEEDEGANWPAGLARSIAFSDNVVRACPIDDEDGGQGALFHELLSLVHVQAKLTERGVFLRGGVTIGDIYMSGAEVFGPGLVRAYELESEFANYPRIVIDPNVIETYFDNPAMRGDHTVEQDMAYIDALIRQSEDGLYFVDYLKACRSELNDPAAGYGVKLKEHAGHIQAAASPFADFSKVKQKYLWLARYHNVVVAETEDADEDCKIDEGALAFSKLFKKVADDLAKEIVGDDAADAVAPAKGGSAKKASAKKSPRKPGSGKKAQTKKLAKPKGA